MGKALVSPAASFPRPAHWIRKPEERAATADERAVHFDQYKQYFEGNNSGLQGETSYLVFTSQAQFDLIFHPAAINGPNTFLPKGAFDTLVVVATIHRGKAMREYDVQKVTVNGTRLYVDYTFKDGEAITGSGSFRSPLILAVAKAHLSKVTFVENGKEVSTVAIP